MLNALSTTQLSHCSKMYVFTVTSTISSLVPEDMDRLQILNSIQKISWTFKERLKDTDDGMSHKYVLILSP